MEKKVLRAKDMDPRKIWPADVTDSSTSTSSTSSSSSSDMKRNPEISMTKFTAFPQPATDGPHNMSHETAQALASDWPELPVEPFLKAPDDITAKVADVKAKHRPKLKPEDWFRYGYVHTFPKYRERVLREMQEIASQYDQHAKIKSKFLKQKRKLKRRRKKAAKEAAKNTLDDALPQMPLTATEELLMCVDEDRVYPGWYHVMGSQCVAYVDAKQLSTTEFEALYVDTDLPCILLNAVNDWGAKRTWNAASLSRSALKDTRLRCGEDDEGYSLKMRLNQFLTYQASQEDDSPLYMFDSNYKATDVNSKAVILSQYQVPQFFSRDLLTMMPSKRRPPHRWWCLGPERSGTSVHIDPLGTSAWNTVTQGVKQWILFPPNTPRRYVKGRHLKHKGEDNEAITWFMKILPRLKREWKEKKLNIQVYEFLQRPGETVFVPGGWYHAVVNLTDTIAVTQNFVTAPTFARVWRKSRKGRKHLARRWLLELYQNKSTTDLAMQAHAINKADGFKWSFNKRKPRHIVGMAPVLPAALRYKYDRASDTPSSSSSDDSSSSSSDAEMPLI